MNKLKASVIKEFLLLKRDIPGLFILFLMPLFLVILISYTQISALVNISQAKTKIVFVDQDNSVFSRNIEKGLTSSGYFDLIKGYNEEQLKTLLYSGKKQVGILIPKGLNDTTHLVATRLIERSFQKEGTAGNVTLDKLPLPHIIIFLDPAVSETYINSVVSSLRLLIQGAEIKIMLDDFFTILPGKLNSQFREKVSEEIKKQLLAAQQEYTRELKARMGNMAGQYMNTNPVKPPEIKISDNIQLDLSKSNLPWEPNNLIHLDEQYVSGKTTYLKPSVIQNNVPAFTLFAMFFIAIPLSGSILIDKNEGSHHRLKTIPVSIFSILSGKIIIYFMVGLIQFILMTFAGSSIFPVIGLPPLLLGHHYWLMILVAAASSLAAIGFGLIIGTLSKTQAQAGMFGSVMVIILGIFGGVFLPTYLMPYSIKMISAFTPMRWGIDSFLTLFVRDGNFASIIPDVLKLFLFFGIFLSISFFTFVRRN